MAEVSLRPGRFVADPGHIDGGALHAKRDAGDRATNDDFITVVEPVQVSDQCVEFAVGTAECLALNSLISKIAFKADRT